MKKSVIIALTFLICLFLPQQVCAESAEKKSQIKIETGMQGTVRLYRKVPVRVTIKSEEDYIGLVQVSVPSVDQSGDVSDSILTFLPSIGTRSWNYLYSQEVVLEKGKETDVVFYLDIADTTPVIEVSLLNEEYEVESAEVKIPFDYSYSYFNKVFVAIVGEKEAEEGGFYDVNVEEVSFLPFYLDPQELPEQEAGLDMLDMVVLPVSRENELSAEQQKALDYWVKDGGILMVEGCAAASDSIWYKEDRAASRSIEKWEEPAWLQESGNGKIIFSEKILSEEDEDILTNLFTEIFTTEELLMLTEIYWSGMEEYWMIEGILERVYMENHPQIIKYVVVISIYLLLVGPFLYYVLYIRRQREYMWRIVWAFSGIFVVLIFMVSQGSRIKAPFLNYLTIHQIEGDTQESKTYFSIQAPYNKDYSLFVDPAYAVVPIVNDRNYGYSSQELDFDNYNVGLFQGDQEMEIAIRERSAFSKEYFRAKINSDREREEEWLDINFFDGKIEGTVRNNGDADIEEAVIFLYQYAIPVGELKQGEEKDLSEYELIAFDYYYAEDAVWEISGYDLNQYRKSEDYLKKCQQYYTMYVMVQDKMNAQTDEALFIGVADAENQVDFQMDSGYDAYGTTIYIASGKVEYERDGAYYNPYIASAGEVVSQDGYGYDGLDNTTYVEEIVLRYDLGTEWTDRVLTFSIDEVYNRRDIHTFTGETWIYNQASDEYEKVTIEEKVYTEEELKDYVDAEGRLIIKYQDTKKKEELAMKLPRILLKGRKSNAEN